MFRTYRKIRHPLRRRGPLRKTRSRVRRARILF